MKLHKDNNRPNRWGGTTYGSLCGRLNAQCEDGMNVALTDEEVTCKFCLRIMAAKRTVPASKAEGWRPISATPEVVSYVARYGGMCRACADEDGFCPSTGLPCEDVDKAISHVISALNYGFEHGYLPAPPQTSQRGGDEK